MTFGCPPAIAQSHAQLFDHAGFLGNVHQLKEGGGTGLAHDAGSMNLDRAIADAETLRDLLICRSLGRQLQDTELPWRECGHARSGSSMLGGLHATRSFYLQHGIDASQEFGAVDRFGQKIEGSGLYGLDAGRYVTMAGQENDREQDAPPGHLLLQAHAPPYRASADR